MDDDRVSTTATYLDLWGQVRDELPTGTRKAVQPDGEPVIPQVLQTALHSLYGTRSRPFPPPKSGRIAVKAINHCGDEVLKVFEIDSGLLTRR